MKNRTETVTRQKRKKISKQEEILNGEQIWLRIFEALCGMQVRAQVSHHDILAIKDTTERIYEHLGRKFELLYNKKYGKKD